MSEEMDAKAVAANARLEAFEQFMWDINQIREVHTSPDGLVEATVDGNGALVGLWMSERVTQRPVGEIEALIVDTARQAVARSAARRGELVARMDAKQT